MKGMILFLTLLGEMSSLMGLQQLHDHHAKVTLKRDAGCLDQFEECRESRSLEECEKEAIECSLAYFTKDEMYKFSERLCSLPALCGGAKKRSSELKRDHDCFEDLAECVHENEEEEEEIPLNEISECQYEYFLCMINEHIETYPDLLEEGKALCEAFREQAPEEPRDCDEELEECLEIADGNEIAVATCDTVFMECELESAR